MNNETLKALNAELERAKSYGDKFASLHEAYGVLAEEVAEVFDIVRQRIEKRDADALRTELLQVAAVAIKAAESMENLVHMVSAAPKACNNCKHRNPATCYRCFTHPSYRESPDYPDLRYPAWEADESYGRK